ncbi:class III poly(R)-hydroxyalkanoic acid synthase subunit PhaE [Methylomagnum sp.]
MTGQASLGLNDWTALWGDAQQKYWQSWMDISRQGSGPFVGKKEEPSNPWAQGFDTWAKLATGAMPTESRDWATKLADANRGYLQMGETLWKTLSTGQAAPSNPEAWWQAVNQGIQQMQDGFATGVGAGKDPWAGFATFWGMPMDNWRRVYSACSAMPGDMEKVFRSFSQPGEPPEAALSRLFAIPNLGYTREWQDEVKEWQRLWLEHGQAARDYGQVLAGIASKASEILGKKLYDLSAEAKTPETLRDFYNLWVDCGEEAYADAATTAEFTRGQAHLVNTLMAVKRQEQKMIDEVLGGLNMPTRRELDTSHRRLHQLQRQVWRLQEALDDSGIRALREEVATLQREMEALRGHSEESGADKRPAARGRKAAGEA